MDNYLELVTLVMGFSLHLDDKEEIIATVLSIKGDLFEQNDDEEYYGLNILKDGIAVTYANGRLFIKNGKFNKN